MFTLRQERISRELRDYRTSISRLNRSHTLPDHVIGERLMDIQIGVVATYLEATRLNLLLPIVDHPAGNPRGAELLPLWQHLQEKAHQSGYGPDPNRLSDASHPVAGKDYSVHLASFRRWIPSAIATVDYLLVQMGASSSKASVLRQLAERIRALELQHEKSPQYDPKADFLVDYESGFTSPILMDGVGRLLCAAYKAKAFDLPAFKSFHTPSITEAALTGKTSEMTRQLIAWLEYRGHKVSGADPHRNPFDRLADALLAVDQDEDQKNPQRPISKGEQQKHAIKLLLGKLPQGRGLEAKEIVEKLPKRLRVQEATLRRHVLAPMVQSQEIINTRGIGYHLPLGAH